jgi:diguanylate cyclase (GGDEF)-like protein/PAS domain S-box-containing protein
MNVGARSRSVLVVAPIMAALFALAAAGLVRPRLINPGPGTPVLLTVTVTIGTLTTGLLVCATLRSPASPCLAWGATAVAAPLLTASVAGILLHWPRVLAWGGFRAAALLALTIGTVVGQRGRRSAREWALLLLDGWLVAASAFMIGWVILGLTGSTLARSPGLLHAALYWIPLDVLSASVVAGLAMRASDQRRTPVLLVVLAMLLLLIADTTWALTGVPQFGVFEWVILMAALGGATLVGPLDLWAQAGLSDAYPPLLRLPQWAVVPGLIVAMIDRGDIVMVATAVSVILGLAAELAMAGRQNYQLWRRLRHQAERLDQLLAESRDALVHVDATGTVRFASEAIAAILGYAPDEIIGRSGVILVHPADRSRLLRDIRRLSAAETSAAGAVTAAETSAAEAVSAGGRVSGRLLHADGGWRTVEATVSRRSSGEPGYILSARDVTERVTLESELRRLADTDALTALSNRPAFLRLLEERLRDSPAAVLFVDLDGFKAVNDMDGHAAGDRLLREVAETLRRELRGRDVAARLGGDEFAVLLGTDQVGEIRAVADRLVQRLRRMPSDTARRTAASVGVAIGHQVSAEALLGDADLAMYEAKGRGGRRYVMFEPWMRERVTERARMTAALEQACRGEGLLLDVQPIVSMTDGAWVGFEALARWQDGMSRRQPQEFLPVAEESGLIDPLGRWVLHRAVAWLSRWPDRRAGVSVNVAGSQLATVGFGDWIHQQLAGNNVSPARLTLEISERTALGDLQRATAVLQPLRALGVRIALDDFGTGFSSLGHLAEVPVDELKIDKRFVAGLGRRAQDDALVRAVCRLAEDLGLGVVAEGVETAAQEHLLLEHGCRLGQGYRFQEPTSISDLRLPASLRPNLPVAPRVAGRPPDGHIVAS